MGDKKIEISDWINFIIAERNLGYTLFGLLFGIITFIIISLLLN